MNLPRQLQLQQIPRTQSRICITVIQPDRRQQSLRLLKWQRKHDRFGNIVSIRDTHAPSAILLLSNSLNTRPKLQTFHLAPQSSVAIAA